MSKEGITKTFFSFIYFTRDLIVFSAFDCKKINKTKNAQPDFCEGNNFCFYFHYRGVLLKY